MRYRLRRRLSERRASPHCVESGIMRAQFRSRIRLVLAFLILAALGIFLRLYFVQIVHGEDYSQKADRQFSSGGSGLFDRGAIYFTRKDGTLISAATLATGFLVAINPQVLGDAEAAYSAILSVVPPRQSRVTHFLPPRRRSRGYISKSHIVSRTRADRPSPQKRFREYKCFASGGVSIREENLPHNP